MKRFLKKIMICAVMYVCCGCGANPVSGSWNSTDTAMGTVIRQGVYCGAEETAQDFFQDVMRLLTELEQEKLSWRLETSEVYGMNASAGSGEGYLLSKEMAGLLTDCVELWEASEGAFDVTMGPVVRLWNIDQWAGRTLVTAEEGEAEVMQSLAGEGEAEVMRFLAGEGEAEVMRSLAGEGEAEVFRIPSGEELEQALAMCGSEHIRLETEGNGRKKVYLRTGMQIDFGAVGKGYALTGIQELLQENPAITGAVISVGGSVLTYGEKPDGTSWKVGIADPSHTISYVGMLELDGQWCVSTSGDYERYVEVDGRRYHHIINPDTGYPADNGVHGVTILSRDGMLSDGLSTACFILGPQKGMALAELYGAEVLFILEDGEIVMSEGMKEYWIQGGA